MANENTTELLRMKLASGLLTPDDVRGMSDHQIVELKSSTAYRSTMATMVPSESDAAKREVVFDGSTEHRDRMGDVVRVHGRKGGAGWQVAQYLAAGGPFLWAHDSSAPPVGQAVKVWKGKSARDPNVNALKFRIRFEENSDYPFANLVGNMFLRGKMTGSSVGFSIVRAERPTSASEREKVGLGPNGIEVTEADLIELSGTPTPANPFALATSTRSVGDVAQSVDRAIRNALDDLVAEGHVSKAAAREFTSRYPLGPEDAVLRLRSRVRSFVDFGMKSADEPRVPDEPEQRSVSEDDEVMSESCKDCGRTLLSESMSSRMLVESCEQCGRIVVVDDDEKSESTTDDEDGYEDSEEEEESKAEPMTEEDEDEDSESEGDDAAGSPMKSRSGNLIVPKQYVDRIRLAFESVNSLAADLDDLLDAFGIEDPQPDPNDGMDAQRQHADLQEGITMILEEMRAMRSISSQAEGGEGVSAETDDPEPNADGVERASAEKTEDVDQLLRDIRSAVSQTP
jgi:hypothetical protein